MVKGYPIISDSPDPSCFVNLTLTTIIVENPEDFTTAYCCCLHKALWYNVDCNCDKKSEGADVTWYGERICFYYGFLKMSVELQYLNVLETMETFKFLYTPEEYESSMFVFRSWSNKVALVIEFSKIMGVDRIVRHQMPEAFFSRYIHELSFFADVPCLKDLRERFHSAKVDLVSLVVSDMTFESVEHSNLYKSLRGRYFTDFDL